MSGAFFSTPARTRGMNPLGALAWVRQYAPERMEEVIKALPPEDRVLLGVVRNAPELRPMSWVPFGLQVRLLKAIDRVVGQGDLQLLLEVGAFMGRRDVPALFARFARLGNPGWMMELSTRLWRLYHDQGRWELQRTPVAVMATLREHAECDAAFCMVFQAWIKAAIEVSGGYEVESAHPICSSQTGLGQCVFTIRWQDVPNPS